MQSEPYLQYKSYIYNHPEYISQKFQSFLFKENPQGLYGYLIDDIIKNKYSEAPSVVEFVNNAKNKDCEIFAMLDYMKRIWKHVNPEKK